MTDPGEINMYVCTFTNWVNMANMATSAPIESDELRKIVLKDTSERLKAELKMQSVFEIEAVDPINRDELVGHVLTLRTQACC